MSDNNPFTAPYSQAYTEAFTKLVPGFDFLQGLVKNAGQALPGIGQWVAPTLDPQELERRISELRTVQFWLEQNARMIATTVQALEVQRMTLGTLRTMNVPMTDLGEALKVRVPDLFGAAAAAAAAAAPTPAPAAAPAPAPAPAAATGEAGAAPGAVDPMQWWGALTQQFTQLATQAMKATAEAAAQASQAVQATTAAAAEAQARAADAVQDVMQSVAAAAPESDAKAPARKAAARKAPAKKAAAAGQTTARAAKKSA